MCVNIECETSLINRNFLTQKVVDYATHVRQCAKFLKIRNIDDIVVIITIYISLIFRIFDVTANVGALNASMQWISMWLIKWLNCYYLGGRVRDMGSTARLCGSASPYWAVYPNSLPMWRFNRNKCHQTKKTTTPSLCPAGGSLRVSGDQRLIHRDIY